MKTTLSFLCLLVLFASSCSTQSTSTQYLQATSSWAVDSSKGFVPRYGHAASVVNGKIYVFGGYEGTYPNGTILNSVQVFDPSMHVWTTLVTTGTFTPRYGLTSSVVNDKIYVMGGFNSTGALNTLEVFDPSTNAWSTPQTSGIFTARYGLSSCALDGKIYVMGGQAVGSYGTYLNTLEVFDPATNVWSTPSTTGLFSARRYLSSAVVRGKIYTMGGFNGTNYINTLEAFDPATNVWTTVTTTGTYTDRVGSAATVLNGKIYFIGGSLGGAPLNTMEIFDPTLNTWSTPATVEALTPRSYLSASETGGKIYAVGGISNNGSENANEAFTPAP